MTGYLFEIFDSDSLSGIGQIFWTGSLFEIFESDSLSGIGQIFGLVLYLRNGAIVSLCV